ncbi:MAG: dihydroorotate dehydrogenase (quinone) [Flavobacteriales bacterium]|nr:quinone-dependent dihydroorotate dehydrogenase [Flavobacteriaceae bacterium]PHX91799.1 MAG: dihydroorotate dehydrogenase (quinone) [Flavobacteriales bacterium]
MYKLLKPLFFLLAPETVHVFALSSLSIVLKIPFLGQWIKKGFLPSHPQTVFFAGIEFPNALGLAAGFDKNAKWLSLLKDLGFGHVEIGTVTPEPQPGNPKPRLFRLPQDNALINRMGFNNDGVEAIVERLKRRPSGLVVGGNIGKNKNTPNEEAQSDYTIAFNAIYDYVDYLVVNISSPNTPGLRDLQEDKFITELFAILQEIRSKKNVWKPILLKIAPDFNPLQIHSLVASIKRAKVDGVIATNTTIARSNLNTSPKKIAAMGNGGLSGRPVFESSNTVLELLSAELAGTIPLIGVGGVFNKKDYNEKISRGASLVQLYTGFIYVGPLIVRKILS